MSRQLVMVMVNYKWLGYCVGIVRLTPRVSRCLTGVRSGGANQKMPDYQTLTVERQTAHRFKDAKPFDSMSHDEFLAELLNAYQEEIDR